MSPGANGPNYVLVVVLVIVFGMVLTMVLGLGEHIRDVFFELGHRL